MPRCEARTINEPFLMIIQMKEKESLLAQRNLEEAKARVDTLVHEQQVHKVTAHCPSVVCTHCSTEGTRSQAGQYSPGLDDVRVEIETACVL